MALSLSVCVVALCALSAAHARSLPGSDPCTWGPSYWCKSVSAAEECGSVDYCVEKQWRNSTAGVLGKDKCTQGPAYWCSAPETVSECGAEEYCARVATASPQSTNSAPFGADKCTWGPSYWCSSVKAADECGMLDHCQEVWEKQQVTQPQQVAGDNSAASTKEPIGGDKCTWGPSYWCSGEDAATACNAMNYCQEEWAKQKTSQPQQVAGDNSATSTKTPIGGDKCTWGPSYWCSGEDAATACNAMDYCKEEWRKQQTTQHQQASTKAPIGQDKCTWGPSYWCSGVDAATACNAMDYCQKVWQATAQP